MSIEGSDVEYLRKLVKKRDATARRIVRIAGHLRESIETDGSDMAIDAAKIDREDLEACFASFETVQAEIEDEVSGDELERHEDERVRIESLVRTTRVSASNFLRRSNVDNDSHRNPSVVSIPSTKIKRPEITVPKFSGEVKRWSEFKNVFKSLVIDEKLYNDVERMIYLKQAVEGKAAEVISNFEISRENFGKAWEKLRKRYENRRAVISNYLEALCRLPSAKSESEVAPLLDAATDAIESLQSVGVENGWQLMLCHLVASKLDQETRKQWELSIVQEEEYPTYSKLEKFLQQRVRVFESISGGNTNAKPTSVVSSAKKDRSEKASGKESKVLMTKENASRNSSSMNVANAVRSCFDCGSTSHSLSECKSFIAKNIEEKTLVVQKRGLCFNCLNRGHRVAFCRSKKCEKCGKRHHLLLHREESPAMKRTENVAKEQLETNETSGDDINVEKTKSFLVAPASTRVCLPAALVYVFSPNGPRFTVRAFLDSASGISVISEKLAKKLRTRLEPSSVVVSTLMPGQMTVSHSCSVVVRSRFNSFNISVNCQVAPSIADDFVGFERSSIDKELYEKLQLADDPRINSGKVDLLLGAELFEEIMLSGKIKIGDRAYLRESQFGWVFIGLAEVRLKYKDVNNCFLTLETNLQRFWAIDELFEVEDAWTDEEKRVDREFENTFERNADGRFVVALPRNLELEMLGSSRQIAFRRLVSLEKRLNKSEVMERDYKEFLAEYQELGHMTKVPDSQALVYLPHHAVTKEESTTTRTRVVFNAAAPTSSGYSLNDVLAKGPVLQDDLLSILMRFRSYKIVFTADIAKMYRQVLVKDDDRKLQCILWRNATTGQIDTYRLNTITYGTKPASYLATKCLVKLAEEYVNRYPTSADKIRNDFYMDDLLTGAKTVSEARDRIREIREILQSGGFILRKFASNCGEVLNELTEELIVKSHTFEDVEAVSVLGVRWTGQDGDEFRFFNKLSTENGMQETTKRMFLSQIFRIYDPLGLLAPVIVSLKLLLQELWRSGIEWDSQVPSDILERFNRICEELKVLPSLAIPRWVGFAENSEIHVFCDASQKGYGAAVYVRTVAEGEINVNLLSAKSRVAPLKIVTIPRLELCATVLGAKLFQKVRNSLRLEESTVVYAWSDSTVVLAWIYFESGNCSSFVANRVSKVRRYIPSDKWFHVSSENNAADIISRGIETNFSELRKFWEGPEFLRENVEINNLEVELDPLALEEMKQKKTKVCLTVDQGSLLFERFSTYNSLISFVAYIMRFSKTLREERYECWELSSFERLRAHQILIRKVQSTVMDKILKFDSFADENGIWRLRSRMGKGDLIYETKYPIILPKNRFLLLLLRYFHDKYFHAGVSFLRNWMRTSYHVIGDLNRIIRGVIYGCVVCRRYAKDLTYDPPVGELPSYRITVSQCFALVGVDFAGPFRTRAVGPGGTRGKVIFKSYVCIFICMVSRAVHIEVVEDLSTKSFLDSFSRFVSRRGLCRTVYSDHGTNFVGADRELRAAFKFLQKNRSEFVSHCSRLGIEWQFIPERAPHFGGVWEAAVKSFKHHFRRVVGEQILSFTEMTTLSCRIEAVMNARPICTSTDSLTTVITPAHLCIGKPTMVVPPISGEVVKGAVRVRYSMVQSIFERFWLVWRREYLIALRGWYYKKVGSRKAQVDDIVLLKEENVAPSTWPMGRIVKCILGSDGVCRVVDVFVNGKIMRRPVVKLIPLLPEQEYVKVD